MKVAVDSRHGVTKEQALEMVKGLDVKGVNDEVAAKQILALYELFVEKDCTMVEVRRQRLIVSPP